MRETSKCREFRYRRGDFHKYFRGQRRVIDIGCGDDKLQLGDSYTVVPWDLEHGDAQLMDGAPDEAYDTVYSSHCLEHVRDWRAALRSWVRICATGGHLYLVIPEFTYYEKRRFPPSQFNPDHKHAFALACLSGDECAHNQVYSAGDILVTLQALGCVVCDVWLELVGYDHHRPNADQTLDQLGGATSQVCIVAEKGHAVLDRQP